MNAKVMKLVNFDSFYCAFFIISIYIIASYKNYLDIAYFLLVSFYYIRIKLHQRKVL